MGQKLREDKILNLQQSGGNISLGAESVLTIGGQQYTLASSIQVALPSLSANTLYMVYAVISGGVPTLVISQNVNSVGPSGYAAWKLVGAFYADGQTSVGFGSFVNIEGVPESGLWTITPSFPNAITLNATGKVDPIARFRRVGKYGILEFFMKNGSGGNMSGSGDFRLAYPTNVAFEKEISDMPSNQHLFALDNSTLRWWDGAGSPYTRQYFLRLNPGLGYFDFVTEAGSTAGISGVIAETTIRVSAEALVTGWSDTPLKDL